MKLFLLSNEVNSAIFELQRAFTFKKEGDPLDVQITTDMYKSEDGIRNMPVLIDLLRKCNSVEIKTGNPINWFLDELYNSLPNVKITLEKLFFVAVSDFAIHEGVFKEYLQKKQYDLLQLTETRKLDKTLTLIKEASLYSKILKSNSIPKKMKDHLKNTSVISFKPYEEKDENILKEYVNEFYPEKKASVPTSNDGIVIYDLDIVSSNGWYKEAYSDQEQDSDYDLEKDEIKLYGELARRLQEMVDKGKKSITLYISTRGGIPFYIPQTYLSIINTLEKFKDIVNLTVVFHMMSSAGTYVMCNILRNPIDKITYRVLDSYSVVHLGSHFFGDRMIAQQRPSANANRKEMNDLMETLLPDLLPDLTAEEKAKIKMNGDVYYLNSRILKNDKYKHVKN